MGTGDPVDCSYGAPFGGRTGAFLVSLLLPLHASQLWPGLLHGPGSVYQHCYRECNRNLKKVVSPPPWDQA